MVGVFHSDLDAKCRTIEDLRVYMHTHPCPFAHASRFVYAFVCDKPFQNFAYKFVEKFCWPRGHLKRMFTQRGRGSAQNGHYENCHFPYMKSNSPGGHLIYTGYVMCGPSGCVSHFLKNHVRILFL